MTKKNTFFSIVTASLNSAGTITDTLESVRHQTFRDIQHIVIDGGSSDGTQDILKNYEGSYNICWKSETDEGIADALNKGLQLARGQYILVLQADDQLLENNSLEKAASLIMQTDFDIYSFPVIFNHSAKGKIVLNPIRLLWWNHFKFIFFHQGCFVHRRVFDKIGNFRKEFKIAFDYEFFYRALKNQQSVKFCDNPLSLMSGGGVSSSLDIIDIANRLKEERVVQNVTENNIFWTAIQKLFWFAYLPYKKWAISKQKQIKNV